MRTIVEYMQLCHINFYQKIAHKKVARVNAALGLFAGAESEFELVFLRRRQDFLKQGSEFLVETEYSLHCQALLPRAVVETDSSETKTETAKFFRDQDRDQDRSRSQFWLRDRDRQSSRPRPRPKK